jgi:hypothetical protein
MSDGDSIASKTGARPASGLPSRAPKREELAASTIDRLREDRPYNADLLVVDIGEGPMVVKDFAPKPWWVRLMGWILISHECRAYRRLGAMRGVPAFVGRVDRYALAMEKIEGVQLTTSPDRYEEGEQYLREFAKILDRFEERGFLHLDLRGRQNVLLKDDGELVVLDLAGAFWFRPGGFLHRMFSPLISWNHDNTLAKWKVLLAPDTLSEEDLASLRRFRNLQFIWLFNRKGSKHREYPLTPGDRLPNDKPDKD